MRDETERIAMLARVLDEAAPGVALGIGDDAAVLDASGQPARPAKLVWTIDEQVEGVHFRRELLSWREVGTRSFMAAASDVAAMGARPWCALCAMVLPADLDDDALEGIATGQREAADVAAAPVVGGNLSRGPALSIATTLLGTCERAVTRAGARPGDGLWMAGHVGLAAAGLRALEGGKSSRALGAAIAAWRTPRALFAEGLAMSPTAHAAIDVSDGLARDAGHLAGASGVRIVIDEAAILGDTELVAAARELAADPLDLALHGGEDCALVVASDVPVPGFRRIGDCVAGRGLALRAASGAETPIEPLGFDHFSAVVAGPLPRGNR